MSRAIRCGTLAVLFCFLVCVPLFASNPWDGAPFSADPKALIAAASQIAPKEGGVIVLLTEANVTFDAKGLATRTEHRLYRVTSEAAVGGWSSIEAPWSPWYEEQPKVEARVVAADGSVHMLDPKSFEKSDADDEPDMFTDTRVVSGPLPAVAPGSVVEELITYRQKNTLYEAGTAYRHDFWRFVETQQSRFTIEYPTANPIHLVNRTKPEIKPQQSEAGGATKLVFETGRFEPVKMTEFGIPPDASDASYIAFSTGRSWQDVATRYAEIIDRQLAPNDAIAKLTTSAVGDAKTTRDIAARLLAQVEQGIRYAGVEFGEGSIVPRTPAETINHKYGDCKDKATLLVAMLRQAGVPAHVALLDAGSGADVDAELPGLGRFNHVIVYVPGEKLWIDPTDEFARAGELPDQDQGRRALIASKETTALVATPRVDAGANGSAETREFVLAEDGKSNPTETTEYSGSEERSLRRYYATADPKTVKEQLEKYVKETYVAESLGKYTIGDPHDLTKPFRLSVEIVHARRGVTADGEAAVGLFAGALARNLPWDLQQSDDDTRPQASKRKPRQHDYEFSQPFVSEVRNHIQPPPGFTLRSMPKDETLTLGTTTLSKSYAAQPDGSLVITYRFDSGPRRITAAQYEATRDAIAKLVGEQPFVVVWDSQAKKFLDAGEVGKAIAEMRRLSLLHPKEALHHVDIATALLEAGFGTAARAEAKVAMEVEPKSAKAHRVYALTLVNDAVGREFGKGFDLDGATREYRKAKELDPKDVYARSQLAVVLQRSADGVQYGTGAKLEDAVTEYLGLKQMKDDVDVEAVDRELMVLYLRTNRFKELRDLAKKTKDTEKKDTLGLVATAMLDGAPAAVAEAQTFEIAKRRDQLTKAAAVLTIVRQYPQAAELMSAAAQGAPNAAELREQLDLLRKMKRLEDVPPKGDPSDVARRFIAATTQDPEKAMHDYVLSDVMESFDDDDRRELSALKHRAEGLGSFVADAALAAIEMQQDGSDDVGYRLVGRSTAGASEVAPQMTTFLVKESGKYKVAAVHFSPEMLGLRALRLADAGKLDAARQWLDWAREYVHGSDGDDPVLSPPFAALWTRGKQGDADLVRVAAATLIEGSKKSAKLALPVLEAGRAKIPAEQQWRVDVAILGAANELEQWDKVLDASDRLLAKNWSPSAFLRGIHALAKLHRVDEAKKRAQARLADVKNDRTAIHALARLALETNDYPTALAFFGRLLADSEATANDFNEHAWLALFTPFDLDKAIDEARRATSLAPSSYEYLNTLATLYAEQGKSAEARQMLLKSLEAYGESEVRPADWYVVGRIAENYGINDIALDAYKRVSKPDDVTLSAWELAQGRLSKLSAK